MTACEECGGELVFGVHVWVMRACFVGFVAGPTVLLVLRALL